MPEAAARPRSEEVVAPEQDMKKQPVAGCLQGHKTAEKTPGPDDSLLSHCTVAVLGPQHASTMHI